MNRYYSYEVYCQCGGSPVRRMKHPDPEKHRDTRSRRASMNEVIFTVPREVLHQYVESFNTRI